MTRTSKLPGQSRSSQWQHALCETALSWALGHVPTQYRSQVSQW